MHFSLNKNQAWFSGCVFGSSRDAPNGDWDAPRQNSMGNEGVGEVYY
jgi:hypothetical protein